MTIRYDHRRESTINLTGGPYVTFPAGVVEVDLDDPDREQRIADYYDAVELVAVAEADDDSDVELCGAIKTNGEPCDRLADECRWHSQDEDEVEEEDGDTEEDEDVAEGEDNDEDGDGDGDGVLDDVEIDIASDHVAADVDVEECGAVMTDGSVCHRPAATCHFHEDDEDEDEDEADDSETED